jgi:purine-nucleoside/S-methyl-5'-thioadenosine phosphorylase / adenosine deaminase
MPELIRWEAPGPYDVAFSTRTGGVSTGPYESLNLGLLTDDDRGHVEENRRRLFTAAGADPDRAAWSRQVHGATVVRARRGERGAHADALWTDEPYVPLLVVTADCLPVALVRSDGDPGVALVHAGRAGILAGVLGAAVEALGGTLAAAIGPSAGPCCYEVGDEIAGAYRARFARDVLSGRKLDLWGAAETALRGAGVHDVHRMDVCTICNGDRFFSHRRDGGVTGRQGAIAAIR